VAGLIALISRPQNRHQVPSAPPRSLLDLGIRYSPSAGPVGVQQVVAARRLGILIFWVSGSGIKPITPGEKLRRGLRGFHPQLMRSAIQGVEEP
jgi:hypothetical protein